LSGGTSPFNWTLTTGALPGGLSLDGGTGAITGTPNAAGNFTFTLHVLDSGGQFANQFVNDSDCGPSEHLNDFSFGRHPE
jgi:hypothetical protein